MARKRKAVKPRSLYIPVVPAEASWIESDSYDRRAWHELGLTAPTINDLVQAGERLVPHFGALLQDLFFGLFKYNLVWNKPAAVRESAVLNRTILEKLIPTPGFEMLKARTLLEDDMISLATELAHSAGDRVIEAAIERVELVDADRLAVLLGELGDRLAQIAVVVNDLIDGEPLPE